MNKLTLDTETTGVVQYKKPLTDSSQPRCVQLSVLVHNKENYLKTELNILLKPDDWVIPKEASDVHGITTEDCEKFGLSFVDVWKLTKNLLSLSNVIIAHNFDFDSKILFIELYHMFLKEGDTPKEAEKKAQANFDYMIKKSYCTMKAATDILKLPSKFKRGEYKWPNLQETHKFFTGKEFEGAHDASADTKAAFTVYKYLTGEIK